jgi:hypothetical protein
MELPGQVNVLAAALGDSPGLIPATFATEQRTEKKPFERYVRKYPVPVLRIREALTRLAGARSNGGALVVGNGHEIDAPRRALGAGATATQTEGQTQEDAGGKGQGRTAVADTEPEEAHAPASTRAEPAPSSAPPREGGSRASGPVVGTTAGSPPPGPNVSATFVRSTAKRLGLSDAEMAEACEEVTGNPDPNAIPNTDVGNQVVAKLQGMHKQRAAS